MCLSITGNEVAALFIGAFGITAAATTAIGGAIYAMAERRGRARWWDVPLGDESAGPEAGPFRTAGTVPRYMASAPDELRWASFWAIAVGLWALPVALIALPLVLIKGLGLMLSPILIAGWRLVAAGRGVLLRDFSSVREAKGAADLSTVVAMIFLGLVFSITLLFWDDCAFLGGALTLPPLLAIAAARNLGKTVRAHQAALDVAGANPLVL